MSFEFEISDQDQQRADIISHVGRDLQRIFLHRKHSEGLTQQKLADELSVDKSRVNRCLSGHANLTLGTLADITHAMNAKVLIKLIPEEDAAQWALSWTNPNKLSATGSAKNAAVSTQNIPSAAHQNAKAGELRW